MLEELIEYFTQEKATQKVLGALSGGSKRGNVIRKEIGWRSYVAFYEMMARLEDQGLVRSWDEQKVINGVTVKLRTYALTNIQ